MIVVNLVLLIYLDKFFMLMGLFMCMGIWKSFLVNFMVFFILVVLFVSIRFVVICFFRLLV